MARPLWSDAGLDAQAIADHLDHLAETATRVDISPRELPEGADQFLLHKAAILRAQKQVAQRHGEKDRIIAEEIRAIDDLVRTANLLVERLREWYALHAPEATRLITDSAKLATLVAEHGDRDAVMAAIDQADAANLGTALDPADMEAVQGFAAALKAVHDSWAQLEIRVSTLMEEVAPNVSALAGPVLGARLISLAGSLQRLATVPASTLQLYGAETALFRHIKEGTRPPKHGVLFQHPLVHQAPIWQRGAIARTMALYLTICARADSFTGNDLRESTKENFEKDLARIRSTKSTPPKRPPAGRGPPQRRGPGAPRGPSRSGPGGPRKPSYGDNRRDDRRDNRGPPRDGRPAGRGGWGGRSDGRSEGRSEPRREDRGSGRGSGWGKDTMASSGGWGNRNESRDGGNRSAGGNRDRNDRDTGSSERKSGGWENGPKKKKSKDWDNKFKGGTAKPPGGK